jgi:hypothetical protein
MTVGELIRRELIKRVFTPSDDSVKVKTYMSKHQMSRDAKRMVKKGYRVAGQSGQFNQWKLSSGKDTVTVTWMKDVAGAGS